MNTYLYFYTFYILSVEAFTLFLKFYNFNFVYSPLENFLPVVAELRGTKVGPGLDVTSGE